jgi:hypothetical protein
MNSRWIISGWLLLVATGSAAEQASGRIDLNRFAEEPTGLVSIGAAFLEEGPTVCPEDQVLLRISRGVLMQLRAATQPTRPHLQVAEYKTIDDETSLHRYQTFGCRIDLSVRTQVLTDGSWRPVLVPRKSADQLLAEARERVEQLSPEERRKRLDSFRERQATGWSFGRIGTSRAHLSSNQGSADCFQAIGEYVVHRKGITFSFPTDLPGDVNRFVIERSDVDDDHARFYFVRDACRFELTIGKSVLRGGEWFAVPLAPTPPTPGQ